MLRRDNLVLLQLKPNVFERRYLLPWEICTCLLWSCVGYYMRIQHILLFAIIYTSLDVVRAKPKLIFHIIGGIILLLQSFVRRSMCAIFASFDFDIAQSPSVGLQSPISFGKVGWKSYNMPMGRRTINLQYQYGIHHTMLCTIQQTHMCISS
jgi:hypothetical protein